MNILYSVFFNAPMGGLHENIYSSALFMRRKGCEVYVILKPGLLQERLNKEGIKTITTDFSDTEETLISVEKTGTKFDLVHFHPGLSKYVAIKYAKKYNIPLIETYHGTWMDELKKHIEELYAIVTVSDGIKEHMQKKLPYYQEKYYVMPNGYDSQLFNYPKFYNENKHELNIAFITRFDWDKQFIIDIMLLSIAHIKKRKDIKINVNIIGDGTRRNEFIKICKRYLKSTNHTYNFKGWLVDHSLKEAYLDNDIIIAPGRAAIEAMASGKAVIAVGSKNYIGLITEKTWQSGVYSNFGGAGERFKDYKIGSLENDLDFLLNEKSNITKLGKFSYEIANQFFNADDINKNLLNLYKILRLGEKIK